MYRMTPHPLDLFGDVVITHADVRAWLVAVPRLDPESTRAAHYVRTYGVIDKIRFAKQQGMFDACTLPRMIEPKSQAWWDRMCWR
jgi:hypothetical protein